MYLTSLWPQHINKTVKLGLIFGSFFIISFLTLSLWIIVCLYYADKGHLHSVSLQLLRFNGEFVLIKQ